MQPAVWRYLEGYDTAIKAEDHFAARFYSDRLLSLPEQFLAAPMVQIEFGFACCKFGNLLRKEGKRLESVEWYERAVRTFDRAVRDVTNWPPEQWYNYACVYAIASSEIADKRQYLADRAMGLLKKAVIVGFEDTVFGKEYMKNDTDLDPLRNREDFKELIQDLEKKSPAKPEPKSRKGVEFSKSHRLRD